MNQIICHECYLKRGKCEEKTCSHGCGAATCVECGAVREGELDENGYAKQPFWHCLGIIRTATQEDEKQTAVK